MIRVIEETADFAVIEIADEDFPSDCKTGCERIQYLLDNGYLVIDNVATIVKQQVNWWRSRYVTIYTSTCRKVKK